jgi:capsid protein
MVCGLTRHPNEWSSTYLARKRIPAESVIHAFDPDSANQTRGVPWMCKMVPEIRTIGKSGSYL